MKKTKKINVLSYALFHAQISAFAGFVAGLLYSFGGLLIDILVTQGWIVTNETPGLSYGTVLAFGAIPVMPLYFAVVGFFIGLVGAFLYNVFSKWFGRKNLDFKQ